MTKGKLLLLPNVLGDVLHHEIFLPPSVDKAVSILDGLIAESEKGGRRFLGRFQTKKRPQDIPIALLNKHTRDYDFLLEPVREGEVWGVVSDAGLPCIADPGARLVARAKETGIKVQAFVGPSSLMMALMQSGLNGQRFHFDGYLPKEPERRKERIEQLAKHSRQDGATQIFIEAPHRNKYTLEALLEVLGDETRLCVAWELTLPTQGILTQEIALWKKSPLPAIEKKPAIFLFNF
jgi:16S rRNA (cytidine1402-2'-O)-methyltransferase